MAKNEERLDPNRKHDEVSLEVSLSIKDNCARQLKTITFVPDIPTFKVPRHSHTEADLLREIEGVVNSALLVWVGEKISQGLVEIVRTANEVGVPVDDHCFDPDDILSCLDMKLIYEDKGKYKATSQGFDWMVMQAGTSL